MAYNNGFPVTYQQMYQPTYQQQPAQTGRIWVQGEAGARSYLVAPNNTIELWDSEAQVIYLKSADQSGLPSIKVLDYTVRETANNTANSLPVMKDDKSIDYVTKTEFDAISQRINRLHERIDKLTKEKENE